MTKLLPKLVRVAKAIVGEKRQLDLFALFKREHSIFWHVVVAAPWATADINAAIDYVVEQLQKVLRPGDFANISLVTILTGKMTELVMLIGEIEPGQSPRRIVNFDYNDIPIRDAYFFALRLSRTSKRKARQPN